MYKVKNKKKNGRSRRTCSEASETAVRSARGSGQVRQGPGNNNHRPICWPGTAWPQGPRHGALRMELSPKSEQLVQPQWGHSRAADTQPHALILLCASALQQWLGYSAQPNTVQTCYWLVLRPWSREADTCHMPQLYRRRIMGQRILLRVESNYCDLLVWSFVRSALKVINITPWIYRELVSASKWNLKEKLNTQK